MATILSPIIRKSFGAPSAEEKQHDDIARKHFLKYCDTGKCIKDGQNTNSWHEGVCLECPFNPYNMTIEV